MHNSSRRLVAGILLALPLLFQNCQFATPNAGRFTTQTNPSQIVDEAPPNTSQTENQNPPATPAPAAPKLLWARDITASWAGYAQDNSKIHIPIGWGYMDPLIAVKDGHQYAVTMTSCEGPGNANFGKIHCVYIVMDGNTIASEALSLANIPGYDILSAYQTPVMFIHGGRLHLAYWGQTAEHSVIHVASIALGAGDPQPWVHHGSYASPANSSLNYLGGTIDANGTLILTGAFTNDGTRRLDILWAAYPYTAFNYPGPVATFGSATFTPLYAHVISRADGVIDVLTTLANGDACSETGAYYTNYKNVILYTGTLAGGFAPVWSDGAPDVAASPGTNGDACLFNNSRFPLDLFYDRSTNVTYSIYKTSNLKTINPAARLASNNDRTAKIRLVTAGGVTIDDDLGRHFTQFTSSVEIDSITMTKLSTGEFVFVANRRDSLYLGKPGHVNFVTTKDFKTFSPSWSYNTPFGTGHSVKVAQPYKNGGDISRTLDFYHGGDLYNATGTIGYTQFRFYRFEP